MPTAATWPCAAPSSLSSRRLGLIIAMRVGKRGGALVMVADDDVEPGVCGLVERLERLRAAIDGDARLAPRRFSSTSAAPRRAIAFHQPVGDVDDRLDAEAAQQQRSAAPRRSRRRRHSRRRWRCFSPPRPRRRAAPRPCPCRRTPTGRAGSRGCVGARWRARSPRSTPRASSNWSTRSRPSSSPPVPPPAPRLAGERCVRRCSAKFMSKRDSSSRAQRARGFARAGPGRRGPKSRCRRRRRSQRADAEPRLDEILGEVDALDLARAAGSPAAAATSRVRTSSRSPSSA